MKPQSRFTPLQDLAFFDPNLKNIDKLVYWGICSHSFGNENDNACPSQETIAKILNVSREYINKSIKRLVKFGYLKIKYNFHKPCNYILTVFDATDVEIKLAKFKELRKASKVNQKSSSHPLVNVNTDSHSLEPVDVNSTSHLLVGVNFSPSQCELLEGVNVNYSSQEQHKKTAPGKEVGSGILGNTSNGMSKNFPAENSSARFVEPVLKNISEDKKVVSSFTEPLKESGLEDFGSLFITVPRETSIAKNDSPSSPYSQNVVASISGEDSTLTVPCDNMPVPESEKDKPKPVNDDDDFWTNWDKQMNEARARNHNPINSLADFDELFGDKK